MIVLTAPRLHALLSRTLRCAWELAVLAAIGLLFVHFLPTRREGLLYHGIGAGSVAVLGWLWLVLFNNGRLALPEAKVSIEREGLCYVHLDQSTIIPWTEYRGYRLTWELPRRIKIARHSGKPLVIDYFAFSKDQRELLRQELDARKGAA